ncbi:Ferrochelatase, protoheme ferro-lyase [hydrothermal vent metagenome]|uniref:Ferrochelatase, protoheme ferro-lyase n=1 Tax=hydrothermal vent metagenome TaxID=652676 RepID=A0A3B1AY57_9ZZZZ
MNGILENNTFTHDLTPTTGILLTNLGTPSSATVSAVRHYLAEFLSDTRVVEIPAIIWKPILYTSVLTRRPKIAAHAYNSIWMEQGSPLLVYSKAQCAAVQESLSQQFDGPIKVVLAMRYGQPSIENGLQELRAANAQRILVLPLYPQYSATTTASTFDAISIVLRSWRWVPELRMVNQYHDFAPYIKALKNSITNYWAEHQKPEKLVLSFHGLPKRNLEKGDPYFCQCHKTARLLVEALELDDSEWIMTFQSRFGKLEWLTPATDTVIKELAQTGVKNIHVVSPGFSADCLETLEEVNMQYRKLFIESGGEQYHYIPALNDSLDHISALCKLIQLHTQGWPEFSTQWNQQQQSLEASARKKAALLAGSKN